MRSRARARACVCACVCVSRWEGEREREKCFIITEYALLKCTCYLVILDNNSIILIFVFHHSFAMDVDFAVFKADGVLLYVSDQPGSPNYYLTIYLMDGFIHLRLKTNLQTLHDVRLLKHYSNGQRYTVIVFLFLVYFSP